MTQVALAGDFMMDYQMLIMNILVRYNKILANFSRPFGPDSGF